MIAIISNRWLRSGRVNKRKREDEKLLKQNRPKVLERDNYSCVLCGGHEGISIHHIVFRSQLGKSTMDNLACLCVHCHVPIAHGVFAKEVRKRLQEIVKERMKEYE